MGFYPYYEDENIMCLSCDVCNKHFYSIDKKTNKAVLIKGDIDKYVNARKI